MGDLFLFLLTAITAYKLASMPYSPSVPTFGQQDFDNNTGDTGFDVDDDSLHHSIADSGPAFNIDGTAMLGAFDMNGNPYGVTQSHDDFINHSGTDHTTFEADPFEHTINIDGTPMCGDIDIHGNPYGVTDWHTASWDCGMSSSSMFD